MSFGARLASYLIVAATAGATALAGARTDDGRSHVATWIYDNPERYYSVSLNAAGECWIDLRDLVADSEAFQYCTYWAHGSRINFRRRSGTPARPLLPIQAEYIPQSDVLILNGDEQRPLRRLQSINRKKTPR